MSDELEVLYEDNHLLAVVKPGGLLVQGDRTGDVTALDLARAYIKNTYNKPGNVFLGLVHRIDRPVSGVVLFARTSKAASRLARAFHDRDVEKSYLAVVLGDVGEPHGELINYVERAGTRSRLASEPSATAKESVLDYRTLARRRPYSLLEVTPRTGRHHQIRVQLSALGHPVAGDLKYGAPDPLPDKTIALHAARLVVTHPVRREPLAVSAPPPSSHPWSLFADAIGGYFSPSGS